MAFVVPPANGLFHHLYCISILMETILVHYLCKYGYGLIMVITIRYHGEAQS